MLKLINKHRKGVSPVIAVILLIALTVATVAIIWQVVLPLLNTQETLMVFDSPTGSNNTDGSVLTVSVVIDSSAAGSWTATVNGAVTAGVITYTPAADLVDGDNDVTLTFTGVAGDFDDDTTYEITVNFTAEGVDTPEVFKFNVTT